MSAPAGAALVTGAAQRIGRALALDLAAKGFDVAVHYRTSAADAAEVVAAIAAQRPARGGAGCGSRRRDETAGLIGAAAAALGPVTLLVNNAAVFEHDRPETADRRRWERHMAINLRAPLVLTQGLLAQLPDGADANVVNLIDQRVLNLTPHYTSYTVSKAGLWALTQHLARALAPRVRVNAIAPGPTLPDARHERRAVRGLRPRQPAPAGAEPRGDLPDAAPDPRGAGDDRADDHGRRRPASRLAAARRGRCARVGTDRRAAAGRP